MSNHSAHEYASRRPVVFLTVCIAAAISSWLACNSVVTPSAMPDVVDADMTVDRLMVTAGRTITVRNNARITVTGDAQVDGMLDAQDSRLTLMVGGNLTISGTVRAMHASSPELNATTPLRDQPVGVHVVVTGGGVTIGQSAVIETNGNYLFTDDDSSLNRSPAEFFNEVENVEADDLPTLVPLPPEHTAFMGPEPAPKLRDPLRQQDRQGNLAPVVVTGTWPPPGMPAPNGDAPVMIVRFNGQRDVIVRDWMVNGPGAPAGASTDMSNNPSNNAAARNGRTGLTLNMRNEGGMIRFEGAVTLNLADGGPGGNATAVCASATAGNGGAPGNLRMSAANGIDLTQATLVINPGRGGDGGLAIVNSMPPGAPGCPGMAGASATAMGGSGAKNEKALFVRGNVAGLENVQIGNVLGGQGGAATATACDGAPGLDCCDGAAGGAAAATGGAGGRASLDVKGHPVHVGNVTGGRGGNATANGGYGGDGGDCKFEDAGDGGAGGAATASPGAGGDAASAIAAPTGGDSGEATAVGGDGGNGGDSGFGAVGLGGIGGDATAPASTPGVPGGQPGQFVETDGFTGAPGEPLPTTLYCFDFAFIEDTFGTIAPAAYFGPVTDGSGNQVGTLAVDLVDGTDAQYLKGSTPDHIGITDGSLCFRLSTFSVDAGIAGVVGGIRIVPVYAESINNSNPVVVRAENADGFVIGEEMIAEFPNNIGEFLDPTGVDVTFGVDETIAKFTITVPENAFLTISRIYLLDP